MAALTQGDHDMSLYLASWRLEAMAQSSSGITTNPRRYLQVRNVVQIAP